VIKEQKWNIILVMPWLACYNTEINWKIGEVKIIRYPKARRFRVAKAKGKKREEMKKRKPKKEKTIEIKRMLEEWEIWNEEEKAVKSEKEAKKLVSLRFHK